MKKLVLLLALSLMILSCGGTKTVRASKKVIKGDWTLQNISYSQAGTYNVTLFNDVSKDCFMQSSWKFIPNNNTGVYTINNSACSTGERNFNFTIQEVDEISGLYDFLLKPTDAKGNSDTNNGFRVNLAQLDETTMTWTQSLNVDGKPFTITMNFSKLN
jgi:hypothetical protein